MTISLRMSKEDTELVKKYAAIKGVSVSDLLRQTIMERIEDEYDLKCYQEAMAEYEQDLVTYSLDEVEKEIMRD